jgi:hypothetical protein
VKFVSARGDFKVNEPKTEESSHNWVISIAVCHVKAKTLRVGLPDDKFA